MKRVTDAKHTVLTLVKIKLRTHETRLNPHLIYLSKLEQIHDELMDDGWTDIAEPVAATHFALNLA